MFVAFVWIAVSKYKNTKQNTIVASMPNRKPSHHTAERERKKAKENKSEQQKKKKKKTRAKRLGMILKLGIKAAQQTHGPNFFAFCSSMLPVMVSTASRINSVFIHYSSHAFIHLRSLASVDMQMCNKLIALAR